MAKCVVFSIFLLLNFNVSWTKHQNDQLSLDFRQVWSIIRDNYDMADIINSIASSDSTLDEVAMYVKEIAEAYNVPQLIKQHVQISEKDLKAVKQQLEAGWGEKWEEVKDTEIKDILSPVLKPDFPEIAAEHVYGYLKTSVKSSVENMAVSVSNMFSEPCRSHMQEYFMVYVNWNFTREDNDELQEWAIRLLDSTAKLSAGDMSKRNLHRIGDISQCTNATFYDQTTVGQYCTIFFTPKNQNGTILRLYEQSPSHGICVPSTCTEAELRQVLETKFSTEETKTTIPDGGCLVKEPPVGNNAKFSWYLLFLLSILVVVMTIADWLTGGSKNCKDSTQIKAFRWSALSTIKEMISNDADQENLQFLDGLRCFSLIHMAVVAELATFPFGPTYYFFNFPKFLNSQWNVLFLQSLPQDTFLFTISCALASSMAHSYFKHGRMSLLKPVFSIFIRWSTIVAFTLMILAPMAQNFSLGPWAFLSNNVLYNNCDSSTILKKILFIDNYFEESHKCWPHLSLLSAGMQLVIITPIIIYPMLKYPNTSTLYVTALVAVSSYSNLYKVLSNELPPSIFAQFSIEFYEKVQICTNTRSAAWLIGLWLGVKIVSEKYSKQNVHFGWVKLYFGWMGATLLALVSIFWIRSFSFDFDAEYSSFASACYVAIHPILWVLALTWATYISTHGYGGFLNSVMQWPLFQMLSKLNLNLFVFYYAIRLIRIGGLPGTSLLSYAYVWDDVFYNLILTLPAAFLLYLSVEGPLKKLIIETVNDESTCIKKTKSE